MRGDDGRRTTGGAEKTFGRKRHQHDLIDGVFYGIVFIWGALVLAADLSGLKSDVSFWTTGWGVFFAGVGILALLGTLLRFFLPDYRRKIGEGIVFGCIFLGIGLGDQGAWIWPVLLAIVGLTILRGVFLQRR